MPDTALDPALEPEPDHELEPDAALDPEPAPELDMEFDPLPDALNEPELEPAPEFAPDTEPEFELEPLLAPLDVDEPEPVENKGKSNQKRATLLQSILYATLNNHVLVLNINLRSRRTFLQSRMTSLIRL